MTEEKITLVQLFAACRKDEAPKARFLSDPEAVLTEYRMPAPEGMNVKVVENNDSHVHITMPTPPAGDKDLSDDESSNAAGVDSYLNPVKHHLDLAPVDRLSEWVRPRPRLPLPLTAHFNGEDR